MTVSLNSDNITSINVTSTADNSRTKQNIISSNISNCTYIVNGYKMVGNAVPVKFAEHLATAIHTYLAPITPSDLIARSGVKPGKKTTRL